MKQRPPLKPRLVLDYVLGVVCGVTGMSVDDIKGKSRTANIVLARHVAIYLYWHVGFDMSYPKIGRAFGNRDHTTALHALRRMAARDQTDQWREYIDERLREIIEVAAQHDHDIGIMRGPRVGRL